MKSIITFTILSVIAISANAQQTVSLTINHLLDGAPFKNNITVENDLGDKIKIDRMEYYISDFQVTHDGGQVDEIEDLYVLVSLLNKTTPTKIELGKLDVEKLEEISFRLGVDEENNHADPALWPTTHPLAPKDPSMHWGWNSGYRFIALEGTCGPAVDKSIQLHCIGDEFNQKLTFTIQESEAENYDIQMNGDYINLLSGIEMKEELIAHGSINEVIPTVTNFVEKTFSIGGVVSTKDDKSISLFEVYPNPSFDRNITVRVESSAPTHIMYIYNGVGQKIKSQAINTDRNISLEDAGIYFISIIGGNGQQLATRKVIIL